MVSNITIYLDTRREKAKGLYPVKIRVYFDYQTRFYSIGINATENDFKRSYLSQKPRREYKALKEKIAEHEARANSVKQSLSVFSFDKFEKRLLSPTGSDTDIIYSYIEVIKDLKKQERINTAISYNASMNSIQKFLKHKGWSITKLAFEKVNEKFLDEYERWVLSEGNNRTTVGIYLRTLRAIFNTAIAEGNIDKDLYPFGKRKFQIPAGRKIKKSLPKEDLKLLFEYKDGSDLMDKARAFWFFSYSTNGMNIKDIAELQYKNISRNTISFVRSKTKNTTKGNSIPIIASLTPFAKKVIDKYGNKDRLPDNYIFPILTKGITETQKVRAVQLFTRFINQHIKKLAKEIGITTEISTYYARHSYTTMAVQNGASLEYIQESLGHADIKTTMNYWGGFAENIKKEIGEKIMDFSDQ